VFVHSKLNTIAIGAFCWTKYEMIVVKIAYLKKEDNFTSLLESLPSMRVG